MPEETYSDDFWYLNKSWQDLPKFFLLSLPLTADEARNLRYQWCRWCPLVLLTTQLHILNISSWLFTATDLLLLRDKFSLYHQFSAHHNSKPFFPILNLTSSFLRHLHWSLQSSPPFFLKAACFQYFVSFPINQAFCWPGWNTLLQPTLCRNFNSFSEFHCLVVSIYF